MENQVHSIHLPDSFPFLKGALERAVWRCFANRLFSSTASVWWLSCCSAGSPKLGARGCGQRICKGQGEGKLLCRAICRNCGGQNLQVLGLRSWRGARKIVTLSSGKAFRTDGRIQFFLWICTSLSPLSYSHRGTALFRVLWGMCVCEREITLPKLHIIIKWWSQNRSLALKPLKSVCCTKFLNTQLPIPLLYYGMSPCTYMCIYMLHFFFFFTYCYFYGDMCRNIVLKLLLQNYTNSNGVLEPCF